jgi:hypothetical protein
MPRAPAVNLREQAGVQFLRFEKHDVHGARTYPFFAERAVSIPEFKHRMRAF